MLTDHEIATKPTQAITYIVACAVLHNLQRGDVMPNLDGNVAPTNDLVLNHRRNDGLAMRQLMLLITFLKFFYKVNISIIMC